MSSTIYPIIPATGITGLKGLWILIPVGLILVSVLGLLIYTLHGSRHATFELSDDGLAFHGDVWGSRIPLTEIRGRAARIVEFQIEPGLRPVARTMGTALPSYQSGWFRLADGEKALLYLTSRERALYIPTTRNYAVLLSPQDPDQMLADLRRMAPTP